MHNNDSGRGLALTAIVIGLIFIVGPIVAGEWVTGTTRVMLVGFGVAILTIGAIITVITRLYQKVSANQAFVRTGMRGTKVVLDGGSLVIPVVHSIIPVNLETVKVEVKRVGKEAIITGNKLRADVIARFFIKVPKGVEAVQAAATSLGVKTMDPNALLGVIGEKLESALRDVGAKIGLDELNSNRDNFAQQVQAIVQKELEPNGLVLESVTILHLDQTPPEYLAPDTNVFDAQGAREIARITAEMRVERNKLEREAEKQVKAQDVERDQYAFAKDVERTTSESEAQASQQKAQAKAAQEAASFAAEQHQKTGVAKAQADQAVALAEVAKLQAADVAERQRQQAVSVAEVEKVKASEVADRERQVALANAERTRAVAETERLAAEQEREAAAQAVQTVEAKATAERARDVAIIAKEAQARQDAIEKNTSADIAAYGVVKEAEGKQAAAEKNASARLQGADAEKQAQILEAEGKRAIEMVPVEVDGKRVEIERKRLEQQEQFSKAAIELQVRLAEIEANKEAKMAVAKAYGEAMAKANITVWGDPSTMKQMSDAFYSGQTNAKFIEGIMNGTPDEIMALAKDLGSTGVALLKRVTGIDLTSSTPSAGNSAALPS